MVKNTPPARPVVRSDRVRRMREAYERAYRSEMELAWKMYLQVQRIRALERASAAARRRRADPFRYESQLSTVRWQNDMLIPRLNARTFRTGNARGRLEIAGAPTPIPLRPMNTTIPAWFWNGRNPPARS